MQEKDSKKADLFQHQKSRNHSRRQDSEENRNLNGFSAGQNSSSVLDEQLSPIDDGSLSSILPSCPAPVCRQFWKAGNYDEGLASKSILKNGSSYLHIHPKFLHSNATSHKWAFGAIAELLDNVVDEIQNGATFVLVDKSSNPRDGCPTLLIQDDGGGMDPEALLRCLSFGFSDKKSKSAIGQYGNGFKTSSMRLGADVIVFTRHLEERKLTQSIGLLSYTFLSQSGYDRIVVPMVDYEFNISTGALEYLERYDKDHFMSNLSKILQWSPYSTEEELVKQFDDIGYHGTKVIIYNLWLNNEGTLELDFNSDPEDICLAQDMKLTKKGNNRNLSISERHLANRLRYSLRVYLSILYLRVPESFSIILRGRVVEHHNIANDLKFTEFILYRPHSVEGTTVTTIGFLKEAPDVNIHGFNVYHKNRLILPFWHVVSFSNSRGRGVVGILEANFIEPIHNKQDFEKTSVFQKLETRLKEMTWEYWDYHCGLIGYQAKKKPRAPTSLLATTHSTMLQPVVLNPSVVATKGLHQLTASSNCLEVSNILQRRFRQGGQLKRKDCDPLAVFETMKRRAVVNVEDIGANQEIQSISTSANQLEDQEVINIVQEHKRLQAICLEYEKEEVELNLKVTLLKSRLEDVEHEYARMLAELQSLDKLKEENNVH